MSGQGQAKICGLCGQDCSDRPRTKDKSGKYFCKGCYDHAASQRAVRAVAPQPPVQAPASRPSPKPQAKPAASEPEDQYGLLGALLDEQQAAPPAASAARLCAACHTPLAPSAVICTHCGFNTASGQQMTVTMAAPVVKGGNPVWPAVVGTISLVMGAGWTILQGIGFAAQLSTISQGGTSAGGRIGGGLLPLMMAIWLARSGYQVLRRDSTGIRNLRRWSIWQLVLCAVGVTCGGILLGTAPNMASRSSGGVDQAALAALAVVVIVYSLGMTIWPIFSLIWTSRAAVRREVDSW